MDWGQLAQDRLRDIAGLSVDKNGVTRFPFTAEHAAALPVIRGWMQDAGMDVHMDAAGTLIGRTDGPAGAPTLLIGSHQDSVRNGGRYDGIMGIALGCLAVQRLRAEGTALPLAVEVLAFADEEGVRFPTALMGPRAIAGTFDPAVLNMVDGDGVTLATALRDFGGMPEAVAGLARDPATILGYLEVHIEQGPVLEDMGVPLGVVSGICGIERNTVTFRGETGHAGTVPMAGRRDALVAAARLIDTVHTAARATPDLCATVGALTLRPNVVNAIPNAVDLTLEIRALNDQDRANFATQATEMIDKIATDTGVATTITRTYHQPAVPCDPDLMAALEAGARHACQTVPHLPSGATHDASAMADLCPMGMLFLRCRGGVSHTPDEYASAADMGAAIHALATSIAHLAGQHGA